MVRRSVIIVLAIFLGLSACGGDDEDSAPAADSPVSTSSSPTAETSVSPKKEIAAIGNRWAPRFGVGDPSACALMSGSALTACKQDFTPPPSGFQASFECSKIEEIAVEGDKAGAMFSNDETVELSKAGSTWTISDLGGNAGLEFFEADAFLAGPVGAPEEKSETEAVCDEKAPRSAGGGSGEGRDR